MLLRNSDLASRGDYNALFLSVKYRTFQAKWNAVNNKRLGCTQPLNGGTGASVLVHWCHSHHERYRAVAEQLPEQGLSCADYAISMQSSPSSLRAELQWLQSGYEEMASVESVFDRTKAFCLYVLHSAGNTVQAFRYVNPN